jgi:hypothetical protein
VSSQIFYTCPCCGYKTRDNEQHGSYDICPICYWEDDAFQVEDPDTDMGANPISLRQAQKNFKEFGACDIEMKRYVLTIRTGYELDSNWKQLDE